MKSRMSSAKRESRVLDFQAGQPGADFRRTPSDWSSRFQIRGSQLAQEVAEPPPALFCTSNARVSTLQNGEQPNPPGNPSRVHPSAVDSWQRETMINLKRLRRAGRLEARAKVLAPGASPEAEGRPRRLFVRQDGDKLGRLPRSDVPVGGCGCWALACR
jgi:hypothetical protein